MLRAVKFGLAAGFTTTLFAAGAMAQAPTIDPADPFGDIDVATAGTSPQEVDTFLRTLTAEQVLELWTRCQVIRPEDMAAPAAGAPEFTGDAVELCRLIQDVTNDDGTLPVNPVPAATPEPAPPAPPAP